MNAPKRPATTIVPASPQGDRRPTLVRPHHGSGMFAGWGPKL
jgi:hypothetical protein